MSEEMDVDWNEKEEGGGATFIEKQRYPLIVKEVTKGASATNLTPFMKIAMVTQENEPAWDKTLWMTPKALYRAEEWFKALQLPTEGKVKLNLPRLAGIRLTAQCSFRTYKDTDGKEHKAVEWINPEPVKIGGAPAATDHGGMAKMAPPAAPKEEASSDEVPF